MELLALIAVLAALAAKTPSPPGAPDLAAAPAVPLRPSPSPASTAAQRNDDLVKLATDAGATLQIAKIGVGVATTAAGFLGIGGAGAGAAAAGAAGGGAAAAGAGGAAAATAGAAGGAGAAGATSGALLAGAAPFAGVAVVAGLGVLGYMAVSSLFADYNPEPVRRLNLNNTMGRMWVSSFLPADIPPPPQVTNADDKAQVTAAGAWMGQFDAAFRVATANFSELQKRAALDQIFGTVNAAAIREADYVPLEREK